MTKAKKKPNRFLGFFIRIGKYFAGMWAELKKVTWLGRKELFQHTGVVLGLVAMMTVVFWIIDTVLGALTALIIG